MSAQAFYFYTDSTKLIILFKQLNLFLQPILKKRKLFLLILALSIANAFIFLFRDHFKYIPYATYNQLYGTCNATCIKEWTKIVVSSDTIESKELLTYADTTSLSKIVFIGKMLYKKFHKQVGIPSAKLDSLDPFEQYKLLTKDTSEKLWCGTYARIFAFFCATQNIVCRSIEIMKPGNHHVLNECYIPEKNQWVVIDVIHNVLLAKSKDSLLDLQTFISKNERKEPIQIISVQQDTVINLPLDHSFTHYYKPEYPFYYYHAINPGEVYTPIQKMKRYVLPVSWFEVYSPVKRSNVLFHIKQLFLIAWLIVCTALLIMSIVKYFRKLPASQNEI